MSATLDAGWKLASDGKGAMTTTESDLARQRRIWFGELIDCPACDGEGRVYHHAGPSSEWATCERCRGAKRIRVGGDDPAKMIELLPASTNLIPWQEAATECCCCYEGSRAELMDLTIKSFATTFEIDCNCTQKVKADLLRCMFPPPYLHGETVKCPECGGHGRIADCSEAECTNCGGKTGTGKCGTGSITLPFQFDPRWLTSTVRDLARVIRGGIHPTPKLPWRAEPDPSQLNFAMLADELEPICDCWEVIEHLQCGVHVGGCFVIDAILGGK